MISVERKPVKGFIMKRLHQLLVPYVVFEIINYVLTIILHAFKPGSFHIPFISALKSIILCINNDQYIWVSLRLWFLPCMAFASILFVVALHYHIKLFILMTSALVGSFIATEVFKERLPFTLDISMLAVFYISLGYAIKDLLYKIRDFNKDNKIRIAILLCCVYIICIKANDGTFYMYENQYGNYWIAIMGSILGSVAFLLGVDIVFSALKKVKLLNRISRWINKNSIIMFPLYLELLFFVSGVVNRLIPFTILSGVIMTMVILLLMVLVLKPINFIKSKVWHRLMNW